MVSRPRETITSEAVMPRNTTQPEIMLALSKSATARALGVKVERVNAALDAGLLVARQCGAKTKIPIFGDRGAQAWFDSWPEAKRKTP
jgi:hypothetical protein